MNSPARRWIVLLVGLHSLLFAPKVFSQLMGPFGPYLTLTGVSRTNVGGICYSTFNFTNNTVFCLSVTNTPVVCNGTNLYTTFTIVAIPDCIIWTDPGIPTPPVIDTVVLGALDPAVYSLVYYVSNSGTGAVWPNFLTVASSTTNTKMLTLCQTNEGFSLGVDGIANVRYIIQSSCDFTNWTGIKTNTGGPFTATVPPPTNACAYYRVQVQQTP